MRAIAKEDCVTAMTPSAVVEPLRVFRKGTLIKGKPTEIDCVEINGQIFAVGRGPVRVVELEDEWYDDVGDPDAVVRSLIERADFRPDIFRFWQRVPDVQPRYQYNFEWEELAVLPIESYERWWNHQIKSGTRNMIRKAEREGVLVRETIYDDDFIRGMTNIFNEAPIRQGRPFWHYGKDFDTVKRQFSRYIQREYMIGAYYGGEMIGFVMLGNAGRFGLIGQIISNLRHRDKATNNALIAKAVEVCQAKGLQYLIYVFWGNDSLTAFKGRSGFQCVKIPRYYVPLSRRGRQALEWGMHKGWRGIVPPRIAARIRMLRRRWYGE